MRSKWTRPITRDWEAALKDDVVVRLPAGAEHLYKYKTLIGTMGSEFQTHIRILHIQKHRSE